MNRGACVFALLVSAPAFAQQGYLPLSTLVDAPYTARMHRPEVTAHSALRPYLREDLEALPGADTLGTAAGVPWLHRMSDPSKRWHGGPLVDALAGASFGESEMAKYRLGAGAWLEWNAGPRWTLGANGRAW